MTCRAYPSSSVPSFVSGHDVVSGRLLSWWNAYKGTSIAQFYQTEHAGCIGVLDTTAIVCIPDEDREEVYAEVLAGFERAKGAIRGQLSRDIMMRHTPELIFKLDSSQDYGRRIDSILDTLTYNNED